MAKVIITKSLVKSIQKAFSRVEALKIIDLLESLEDSPNKGKSLTTVNELVIKELKYEKFRFYFITDGHQLKFGTKEELTHLLIKFVRMSEKKNQQKVINEIKTILKSFGFDSF